MSDTTPDVAVDLTNCDREPIHIPGAIQPYGALLGVDDRSGIVRVASESVAHHLGQGVDAIVGASLGRAIGDDNARRLLAMSLDAVDRVGEHILIDGPDDHARPFDALVHRAEGLTIVELTPLVEASPRGDDARERVPQGMTEAMRGALAAIERAESMPEVAEAIAREMRTLTGFDRVWVYRFHDDWHGEIIGESRRDDIETWLGMHYPASDIPAQARALFLRNLVRVIPDVSFAPSPLSPVLNPVTGVPLNLGNALLRSVSPIHVQYLKNMGVTASLVISLVHQGKLWGLISGHHYSGPRVVSSATRATCEFLAYALSMQVGAVARIESREFALEVRRRQTALIERLSAATDINVALSTGPSALHELAEADGAAIVRGGVVTTIGTTPSIAEIAALSAWIVSRGVALYASDALSREYPAAERYTATASGVLAISVSRDRVEQILWFRGEQKQTVRWAGDPRKPVTLEPGGSARLHPRGSFELWEEEVRGTACPWEPVVLEAVGELRRAILDVLIARSETLRLLNEELQVSVEQLEESGVELEQQASSLREHREMLNEALRRESEARQEAERANRAKSDFLAMMSHELRTPLNAIGGYASLLSLGLRGPTTEEQLKDLARIESNQRHLLGLINNILNFAKVEAGAVQYALGRVDVSTMLASLDPLVAPQMREKQIQCTIASCERDLFVRADEEKLRQVLINLLSNALKFTPAGGTVEMACAAKGEMVEMTVRDTGIGISAEYLDRIFDPFVQVDRFAMAGAEQGTGLGLSISRELVRGMQGDLTATSTLGEGSLFRVTLPRA